MTDVRTPIPRRPFPALGTEVSRLAYGSWPLSGVFGAVDRDAAARSLYRYLEAGGNLIDTARIYGDAESVLGELLRGWSGERPLIASKVAPRGPSRQWGAPVPVDVVFPPGAIADSVHASLRALGVETLDLVQLHVYWPGWGVDGYWLDELEELREHGDVRAIGVSIPDYRHDSALPLVLSGRIDAVQTIVNVFDPLALDNLAGMAADHDVALFARGVLDEGGLTEVLQRDRSYAPNDLRHRYFGSVTAEVYDGRTAPLRALVPEHASTLASLALQAVLGHDAVTAAIVSMASPDLVDANIDAACRPRLPAALLEQLWTRHRWVRNFFEADYWTDA